VRTAAAEDGTVWARGAVAFPRREPRTNGRSEEPRRPDHGRQDHGFGRRSLPIDIHAVIDKALRAAGLK
jgi:hypothetical protein